MNAESNLNNGVTTKSVVRLSQGELGEFHKIYQCCVSLPYGLQGLWPIQIVARKIEFVGLG
jgi:hypothetical protein